VPLFVPLSPLEPPAPVETPQKWVLAL